MTFLPNLHVVTIDLFGVERAAFTSAALASSHPLMQTVLAPAMGAIVDRGGFVVLCPAMALLWMLSIPFIKKMARRG